MPLLVPLLTYVTYASLAKANGDVLGLAKAFTSFSLFVLLVKPIGLLLVALPAFSSAAASIARVQEYLSRQEREPKASLLAGNPATDVSSAGGEEPPIDDEGEKTRMHSSLASDTMASASGQLKWPDAEKPVLDLKQLVIRRDAFTIVLGPMACGKTSLMKLLLGEMPQFEGHLDVRGRGAAYCAQEPFIPSRTCRDVIVGNVPYEAAFYAEVVKACALDADFEQWPEGDASLVGNAGATLSGGQKQRLALARAAYSRKDLVILDDSLTGLDAATESKVFQNLLGREGLFRVPGTTVILCTSSPRHAPHADHVLLLAADGTIADQGSFSELRSPSAALSSLGLPDEEGIRQVGRRREKGVTVAEKAEGVDSKVTAALLQSNKDEVKLNHPARDASVYKYYMGSVGRRNLIIFLTCLVGIAFFDTFPSKSWYQGAHLIQSGSPTDHGLSPLSPAVWLKWWAESNTEHVNAHLAKWLGGYGGLTAGGIIAALFGSR